MISNESDTSGKYENPIMRLKLQQTPTILKYINQGIKNKRTPTVTEINTYLTQNFDVFDSLDNTHLIVLVSDCIQ